MLQMLQGGGASVAAFFLEKSLVIYAVDAFKAGGGLSYRFLIRTVAAHYAAADGWSLLFNKENPLLQFCSLLTRRVFV